MTTNDKEFQMNYMRSYRKISKEVICEDCNIKYKEVYKYNHLFSKNHKSILLFKQSFINLTNII